MERHELLKNLPSVDEILKGICVEEWLRDYPRVYVIRAIREAIERKRVEILEGMTLEGMTPEINAEAIAEDATAILRGLTERRLRPVINASGVVIHTNLGRAPLSKVALENIRAVAEGYCNLEYNLSEGKRGKRYDHIKWILRDLTGAEDTIVVNNNAAAVLLCLSAVAAGREVIISRGELVEIGGSFRVPDVMAQSGAILRETGTTNKTHPGDYESAINEKTALILKVHQSNFRITGFTEDVSIDELVRLGRKRNIPVMFDLGSGCLIDLKPYGIHDEPVVADIVKEGVDIITFSGDKLLGGPQAGVIAGRKDIINKIGRHPLARAVRTDKMTLAALEATLYQYADIERASGEIPVLRSLIQDEGVIRRRAGRLYRLIRRIPGDLTCTIEKDASQAGGGSLPGAYLPTYVVSLKSGEISTARLEETLRNGVPPVITRIKEDRIVLDARTIRDSEIKPLVEAVKKGLAKFFA